jgi:hypothetical protein
LRLPAQRNRPKRLVSRFLIRIRSRKVTGTGIRRSREVSRVQNVRLATVPVMPEKHTATAAHPANTPVSEAVAAAEVAEVEAAAAVVGMVVPRPAAAKVGAGAHTWRASVIGKTIHSTTRVASR